MNTFCRGEFAKYRANNLSKARGPILENSTFAGKRTTVFISHKHNDLNELRDIIGFLENQYNVRAYIDGDDPTMPSKTSGETANRIKMRISQCDKFILLATNGAIESKWCNWELGYGDGKKFDKNSIALFPIKEEIGDYRGNEYMEIYPHIVRCSYGDKDSEGRYVVPGYYVREWVAKGFTLTSLGEWFNK